ncbi:MAG: anti-sigma factor family protein [Pararhodobacter sp.]
MMRLPVSDERLSAYVDGELPPAKAAELARLAVADPDIAARIAVLHALKAGVAELGNALPPELPAHAIRHSVGARHQPPRRFLRGVGMRLAVAVLALVAVIGWVQLRSGGPVADPPQDLAAEIAGHDAWARAFDRGGTAPVAPEWLESMMRATGLRLVHAAPVLWGEATEVMHYAFVGANDCRLSLFEQPGSGPVDLALSVAFRAELLTARWQVHGFGYTLVARQMDRDRFITIAAAVHDVTRQRAPAAPAVIASLQAARQRCSA